MKRTKTIAGLILWFVGVCGPSIGFDDSAGAAEVEKLNVVYSTIATASLTTWVPQEAGLYKKYGFDRLDYQRLFEPRTGLTGRGAFNPASLKTVLEIRRKLALIGSPLPPVEKYFDDSFYREAASSIRNFG